MDLSPLQSLLVFLVTYAGESFGTMFGGGSFFIQPALLAIGIPANVAVANDVTAAAFASLAFIFTVLKQKRQVQAGQVKRIVVLMAPAIILGTVVGGHLMSSIPEPAMRWVVLTICTIGLVYTLFKVKAAPHKTSATFVPGWQLFALLAGLGMGLYDGMSGAGSGILIILALSLVFRSDMKTTLFLANILSFISLLSAGVTFYFLRLLSPQLLLLMVPACLIAGFTAGKLTTLLPEKILRLTYGLIIAALMAYLLHGMLTS